MRPRSARSVRFLAWICVLAILLAAAIPAVGGMPAALAVAVLLDVPGGTCRFRAPEALPAPDHAAAASVPARAPPA